MNNYNIVKDLRNLIKDIETVAKVAVVEHEQGLRVSAKLYQAVKCLEDAMFIPNHPINNQQDSLLHD